MSWSSVPTQTTTGWTSVANASVPTSIIGVVGESIGLLLALTYGMESSIVGAPWTSVITQTTTGWTSVVTSN